MHDDYPEYSDTYTPPANVNFTEEESKFSAATRFIAFTAIPLVILIWMEVDALPSPVDVLACVVLELLFSYVFTNLSLYPLYEAQNRSQLLWWSPVLYPLFALWGLLGLTLIGITWVFSVFSRN